MKVLVLLALVALCYSTPIIFKKQIKVGGDDAITIVGTEGRELDIYKSVTDPRKINIIFKTKYGPTRKIQIDEINNIENVDYNILNKYLQTIPREQLTQGNILAQIFRKYQGIVDEETYQYLLEKIHNLVKYGIVNQSVFDVLKNLDDLKITEQVKQTEAKHMIDNIVQEKLHKDIVMPVEEVNQVRRVSEVPVDGIWRQNQYVSYHPIQRAYGIQGLWNLENMTPYQRQMFYQYLRQQMLNKQGVEDLVMPREYVREQEIKREMVPEQMYKYQWTPLNRFLYNAGVYRTQQYEVPQYYRGQQYNKGYQYQVPQYMEQQQFEVPQYYKHQYEVPEYYMNQRYEVPQYYMGQQYHVPEYYRNQQYEIPEYYKEQQYQGQEMRDMRQLVDMEQNRENVPKDVRQQYYRYAPEETMYQQYGYGKAY